MTIREMSILIPFVLWGCTAAEAPAKEDVQMDETALFNTVGQLAKDRPFNPLTVGVTFGLELIKMPSSNRYFGIYASQTGNDVVAKVEVRTPVDVAPDKGGMILLTLKDSCIKRERIGQQFGQRRLEPPKPPRPPRSSNAAPLPKYDKYDQEWGVIKLGYSPNTDCLVSIILDANEA